MHARYFLPLSPSASLRLCPSFLSPTLMATRRRLSPTFFGGLRAREHGGASGSSRATAGLPYLADLSSNPGGRGGGVIAVEHSGDPVIPFAISFGKTAQTCNLLAVADEDGYVGLYDTRRRLPSTSSSLEKSAETRVPDWVAHNNAIFDVCWIKEGSQILTASGDQTVKIWSVGNRKCIGVLSGHTGSVKSLSCHSSNPELIVSGSRDGSFALWDLRCDPKSPNSHGETCLTSSAVVREAHSPIQRNRTRSRAKAASTSITSVLYLKDGVSIATSGAADNVVKIWDTRNLEVPVSNKNSQAGALPLEGVKHGISCLSQDSYGAYIAASCMDNRIYLYSVLHVNKGPINVYTGSKIEFFFVKSAISPDGTHILGGSSDGNVYLWQVDQPESVTAVLKGHEGEATSVDWCASEVGKIATSSDDSTVRVWSTKKMDCTNVSSPTVIRKRAIAPNTEHRRSITHEPAATTSRGAVACARGDGEQQSGCHSPLQPRG
ncbi:Transducin/WD40 repeat-like superfamily protein [Zea mays]|uniref:Transducin/WD40 repeat-like superfamily protein n=2 Tax=Zea mays TaxID=4577 RepID=A0A1D6L0D6_MAIZE|nr:Transducin/WD40 repeat-like superfamily protein [Zea mays]